MIYFIATLLIFASMEVVSKPLMGQMDPFVLTFWRFAAGFIFFVLYPGMGKRFAEIKKFRKQEWLSVFFLGILNAFIAMSFLQLSVKYSSAATSATIFCSNPIFVMLISSLSGYEKISARKTIGISAGIIAVAIIMAEKGFVFNVGALYGLTGAVVFAGYTVLSKVTVSKISPFTVNMTSFFFGIASSSIFIAISGKSFVPESGMFSDYTKIAAFLYLGFVVTGIGYVTFFETIKRYSAISVSLIFMIKPAIAIILAAVFLGEILSKQFFLGFFFLSGGTALILSDKLRNRLNNKINPK